MTYHDLFDGNTGTLVALDLLSLLQAKLGQACIQTRKYNRILGQKKTINIHYQH